MKVDEIVQVGPRAQRRRERWKSNGSEETRREREIDIRAIFSHLKLNRGAKCSFVFSVREKFFSI